MGIDFGAAFKFIFVMGIITGVLVLLGAQHCNCGYRIRVESTATPPEASENE